MEIEVVEKDAMLNLEDFTLGFALLFFIVATFFESLFIIPVAMILFEVWFRSYKIKVKK